MSASHEWTEWHLTPDGWLRGSERVDFSGVKRVDPPENRVLTCVYDEHLGSSFGKLNKTTETTWKSDNESLIKELMEKYGNCPYCL